ncbi:MAG: hypothetical protein AMXMBFR64_51810 [Myxococcales bacterium]
MTHGIIAAAGFGSDAFVETLLGTVVYAALGLALFAVAFWIINKIVPFSLRKEIEEDQNTALGIVIGAVLLGLSIILAAAIHG